MDAKYNESLNEFIADFNNFVRKDEYLQKREFYELSKKHGQALIDIEKYKDVLPSNIYNVIHSILEDQTFSWIDRKNEEYIARELEEEKEYFDTMFTKYNLPIVLDNEQRKAIISDCEASLIIAGAGTGKTTTMAAKVKYLVEKQKVNPSKILVLSYTNKAVEELKRQIQDIFKLDVNITTFHALGRKILVEKYPFAEERRLFYVALTRTKNKVYLLSTESEKEESIFIKEIKNENNVVERRFQEVI